MDYLQQCIDLRRQDIEPEVFTIALAVRYIRELINSGGSDRRRPELESALHPEHLESFLARAVEIPWKDARLAQEWRKLQQVLPLRSRQLCRSGCLSRLSRSPPHSGTGRSMGIWWHGESTFSRIKRERSTWKGVSHDILF